MHKYQHFNKFCFQTKGEVACVFFLDAHRDLLLDRTFIIKVTRGQLSYGDGKRTLCVQLPGVPVSHGLPDSSSRWVCHHVHVLGITSLKKSGICPAVLKLQFQIFKLCIWRLAKSFFLFHYVKHTLFRGHYLFSETQVNSHCSDMRTSSQRVHAFLHSVCHMF